MLIFSHFNWQWPVYQFWSDVLHFRNSSFCPQKISFCLNQLQFTHLFFSQFRLVSAEDSPAQNAASLKDTPDTHPVPSKNATSMLRDRGLCYPWAFGSHGSLSRCPCHCHGGDSYPHQGAPDSEVCHSPDLQDSQVGSGPQSSQILKPTFAESWKTKPTKPKQENHVVASTKTQIQLHIFERRPSNSASLLPGAFGLATKPRWNVWNGSSRKSIFTKSLQILIQIIQIKKITSQLVTYINLLKSSFTQVHRCNAFIPTSNHN